MKWIVVGAAMVALCGVVGAERPNDPYQWLEEVEGARQLEWVAEHNATSTQELEAVPEYRPIYDRVLEILDSDDNIPVPALRGEHVYNFWKDAEHPRGIWRRTSLGSYLSEKPAWETVLDIDAMVAADGVPWVFKGADCLEPEHRHCLITLSRGGADAAEVREFDTVTKKFVDGGFFLPEAKSNVAWRDADHLWVGTDFGPGTLSPAGYPQVVKLWRRGTPLAAAATIYVAEPGDNSAVGFSEHTPEGRYDLVYRSPAYYRQEVFLRLDGRLVKLDYPEDAEYTGFFKDRLLLTLRSEWAVGGTTYPGGALLAIDLDAFLRGGRAFDVLFEPSARVSLSGVSSTRDRLILTTLDNVRSRMTALTPSADGWSREEIPLPGLGTAGVVSADDASDRFFFSYNDFLTPSSIWLADSEDVAKVKTGPAYFDADGMKVEQYEATSADGTKVPYFVVLPKDFKADGTAPTLLHGYGGFEVPQLSRYSAATGVGWLERGGVYALANIRGGGEFGPAWHRAALKENRIKSFEDFIAVAEDLVRRKITSPKHLGIEGGSQGGLLVGGAYTMRPELFGAVISAVPLADMQRFNKLLAGASWMAEYGNPDLPEDWAFIKTWSPYHLLSRDADYPTPFFWTNMRDDRVHPAHARKMVAKMEALGHPVMYFENTEGGHGSGSVNTQTARVTALEYAYLWKMLG